MPTVWLLSAYRADSHAAWADWLADHIAGIDWRVLELPGRNFAWRIRGNPLSWIDRLPDTPPDRILATSMVDLATLRGLHPRLAGVPCWYYFHENQFAYPLSKRQVRTIEPRIVQLYGALAADRLLFNSAFNRDSFLAGVDEFLELMPDAVPSGLRERLAARASVLPVPVEPVPAGTDRDRRLLLWNHRWEYDKAPEVFAEALLELDARGIEFRVALLGRRGRGGHPALERLRRAMPGRIVADGRLDEIDYRALLGRCGLAVSTAIHEFQGISMLEAASAGASVAVPDALCYREQYPAECRYRPGDAEALAGHLARVLEAPQPASAPDVSSWLAPAVAPRWQALLNADQSSTSSR